MRPGNHGDLCRASGTAPEKTPGQVDDKARRPGSFQQGTKEDERKDVREHNLERLLGFDQLQGEAANRDPGFP